MSSTELATRMGVGQSTISGLENSEIRGTIKLDTLRRAAAALDCDVIYYLAPRTSLEDVVRLQARRKAHEQLAREAQPVSSEEEGAADSSDRLDELAVGYMDRKGLWAD
jgi:predicted DNA-binding mobile mystery protein A